MKRLIDYYLLNWKKQANRKPLLLRGARQVGKTHAVRDLGKTFDSFIEINLEVNKEAAQIFEKTVDARHIIFQLSELLNLSIKPHSTLLFIDEIQNVPNAIIALRYFYEFIPDLHVVAAGSLLDFAIEQVGMPVGRITQRYMYPLSFLEFLVALNYKEWAKAILKYSPENPMNDALHAKLIETLGIYLTVGGMPNAINEWILNKTSSVVQQVHADILFTYEQDFGKYSKKHQIKYLNLIFRKALDQLGRKFMYSRVGEYQKRELQPALELLEKAGLLYPVVRSSSQGLPIGANVDLDDFKIIFLDVGLAQALLKQSTSDLLINPLESFTNKGELIEAFIGQELLANAEPISKGELFYWRKNNQGNDAEIDYLVQFNTVVVPIEVKAGGSKRIKSMHIFLDSHQNSPHGIRLWANSYAKENRIDSYPLYAVSKIIFDSHEFLRGAMLDLVA